MAKPDVSSLPGSAIPWGRKTETRLGDVELLSRRNAEDIAALRGPVDKTVVASFNTGQNIAYNVTGKVALSTPTVAQYVSSTGLFEVTVSLAGLVMAGGILGLGFEHELFPYETYFDSPKNGVVGSCDPSDTRWVPFSGSRSTIISTRPGVYALSLYLHVNTTQNATSKAFVDDAQISIKAV